MFTIHAQKIEETQKKSPAVLEGKGEIEQYPSCDEWDEYDEEWEWFDFKRVRKAELRVDFWEAHIYHKTVQIAIIFGYISMIHYTRLA